MQIRQWYNDVQIYYKEVPQAKVVFETTEFSRMTEDSAWRAKKIRQISILLCSWPYVVLGQKLSIHSNIFPNH